MNTTEWKSEKKKKKKTRNMQLLIMDIDQKVIDELTKRSHEQRHKHHLNNERIIQWITIRKYKWNDQKECQKMSLKA